MRWGAPAPGPGLQGPHSIAGGVAAVAVRQLGGMGGGLSSLSSGDLSIGEEIGKGRFKRVVEGTLKISAPGEDADDRDDFIDCDVVVLQYVKSGEKRELQVLTMLAKNPTSCPFVPEIYGAIDEGRTVLIVQERAHWGSLKAAISKEDGVRNFTFLHKLYGSAQLSRAMGFLSSMRIVHADLSCRNILLCNFCEDHAAKTLVKVTDFGLAVILKDGTDSEIRKQPQATRWCAPETVAYSKFSHRSDVWSLGTTLWELFSGGELPWVRWQRRSNVGARLRTLAEVGAKGGSEDISEDFPQPAGCNASAHSAVLACLRVDELARPGFAQLVEDLEEIVGECEDALVPEGVFAKDAPSCSSTTGVPSEVTTPRDEAVDEGEGCRLRCGSTTPSTSATPSVPWWRVDPLMDGPGDPLSGSKAAAFAEALREFLHSPRVLELLGDKAGLEALKDFLCSPHALDLLASEAENAQAREKHLVEFMREHTPQHSLEDDELEVTTIADLQRRPCSETLRTESLTRTTRFSTQPRWPASAAGWPLRDVLVPLFPGGVLAECTGPTTWQTGVWTLLSLISPTMLRRRDFVDEADAFVAFHACGSTPCILRDPRGADAASSSWVVIGCQPIQGITTREAVSLLSSMPRLSWSSSAMPL